MKTETADLAQLQRDATDKIIFHATPREWLRTAGPWVLDRGEGAFLYDAAGREYLDALSGGVFAVLAEGAPGAAKPATWTWAPRWSRMLPRGSARSLAWHEIARPHIARCRRSSCGAGLAACRCRAGTPFLPA